MTKQNYRTSPYIDFDTGSVRVTPMAFYDRMDKNDVSQRIDYFQCRVDVWQLGAATALLREIENPEHPDDSIWHHSAYQLLSMLSSYFEFVGKILNPNSKGKNTSGADFNWGFCDVYPTSILTQPQPTGHTQDFKDETIPAVEEIRNLMRNGLYHLGFAKDRFFIHNNPTSFPDDFSGVVVVDSVDQPTQFAIAYLSNPHNVTRTVVNHFGQFIERLKEPSAHALRTQFSKFESFFEAPPRK